MAHTIGLRVYRVTFHERGQLARLPNDDSRLFGTQHLLDEFVKHHISSTNLVDAQRGWFFENPNLDNEQDISSIIQYGVHGIASTIVDVKTRVEKYKRQLEDMEEIPLFFRAWRTPGEHYCLMAFQSFGPRSCVGFVQSAFVEFVKAKTGEQISVRYRKLMPTDSAIGPASSAPVKEITLIKHNQSSDRASDYLNGAPNFFDVKLSLVSRRKEGFGFFGNINEAKIRKMAGPVALVDDFDSATAEVLIAGKRRKIGIFGDHSDVGTIDITEEVVLDNSHPTSQSMLKVTKEYMNYFHQAISEAKV